MSADPGNVARWRLVLGRQAESRGITASGDPRALEAGALVDYLYDAGEGEGDHAGRKGGRSAGGDPSTLTVNRWIDGVAELFPRQARELMERELVRRRGIGELLEQPELLERIEPNVELVKTLLTHRELLSPQTRGLARKIIDQVVQQLKQMIRLQVESTLTGALRRDRHSPRRVFRNLDLKTTVRRNLHNWDAASGRLLVDRMWFHAAERNQRPWHVIVTVDQSGSMLESAIFSAVMASIFHELPQMKASLVLFDTQVVDLSNQLGSPVDVLLSVNLGGGTHIGPALAYASQLVREPARSVVVLITDFYEGRSEQEVTDHVKRMAQSGIRMIGLGALGIDARPEYNRNFARKLRKVGMDVLSCTPDQLAKAIARIIRR